MPILPSILPNGFRQLRLRSPLVCLVIVALGLSSCSAQHSRIDVSALPRWSPNRPPVPCIQTYEILSWYHNAPDHESMDPVVLNIFDGLTLYDFGKDIESFLRFDACRNQSHATHLRIHLHRAGNRGDDPIQDSLDIPFDPTLIQTLPGWPSKLATRVRILRIGNETPSLWSHRIAAPLRRARDSGGWLKEFPDRSRHRETDWLLENAWIPGTPRTLLLDLATVLDSLTRTDTITLDLDSRRVHLGGER